jgi:hydroxymethylpyrimidine/phosphomethylpyrimidine kinase
MTTTARENTPVVLTIAGSDSGGGAGIQADLLTIAALRAHGTTAITCLTAQNPAGVSGLHAVPPEFVLEQARQVARHFPLAAIKTGMLLNAGIVRAVAEFINELRAGNRALPVVIDPVLIATSGARLLDADALGVLTGELLPLATLITPNLDEAEALLAKTNAAGSATVSVTSSTAGNNAATALAEKFGTAVLLKGGHAAGDTIEDILAKIGQQNRPSTTTFTHPRIAGINTHGSGCTLSAAIATRLAFGDSLTEAVAAAIAYFTGTCLSEPLHLAGELFLRHCPALPTTAEPPAVSDGL